MDASPGMSLGDPGARCRAASPVAVRHRPLCRTRALPAPAGPDTVHGVLRRVIGLTVFTAVLATAFIVLGRWQLSRLDERRADNAQVASARDVAAVPVDALAEPGTPLDPALEWRRATATGQLRRRRRRCWCATAPTRAPTGCWWWFPSSRPRGTRCSSTEGWIPAAAHRHRAPGGAAAAERGGGGRGAAPPRGAAAASPGPAGRTGAGDRHRRALPRRWPHPSTAATAIWWWSGRRPTPPRRSRSRPRLDEGPHLGYAIQWFCFAAIAAVGYVILLTRGLPERDPLSRPVRAGPAGRRAPGCGAGQAAAAASCGGTGCGTARRRGRPRRAARRGCRARRPAAVDHQDLVGVADGGEPVGDHQRGPARQGVVQRLLHGGLGLGVQVRGGLVEHHDVGGLEQQPGDRQPLLLAAGEPVARGRRPRCPGRRAARPPVADLGGAQRRASSSSVASGPGVQQVGADGVVEQVRVLGHHADRVVQRLQRDVAHVRGRPADRAAGRRRTAGRPGW